MRYVVLLKDYKHFFYMCTYIYEKKMVVLPVSYGFSFLLRKKVNGLNLFRNC